MKKIEMGMVETAAGCFCAAALTCWVGTPIRSVLSDSVAIVTITMLACLYSLKKIFIRVDVDYHVLSSSPLVGIN